MQLRRRFAFVSVGLCLMAFASACQVPNPTADQVASNGAGLSDLTSTRLEGAYGSNSAQAFTLYRPRAMPVGGSPVVVYVHGGAWQGGTRGDISVFGESVSNLVNKGWAVATVDYRLVGSPVTGLNGLMTYPNPHPLQIQDVKRAIRYFKANGQALFGLNPSTVMLAGHSAGGHLALLAGTSCNVVSGVMSCEPALEPTLSALVPADELLMTQNSRVNGVIALAPVVDIPAFGNANIFGSGAAVASFYGCPATNMLCKPSSVIQANPLTWLDVSDPPIFLAHGTADAIVSKSHSSAAFRAAAPVLGDARVWIDWVDGSNHDIPGVNAKYVADFAAQVLAKKI